VVEPELEVARAVLVAGCGVDVEAGDGDEIVIGGLCVSGAALWVLAGEVPGV
jgi:hypothetical protein